MSITNHQLTCIPAELHGTKGKLFRCCLPFSATLDPEGTLLEKLKSLAGGEDKPVLVVAVPPSDEILRLTDGRVPDIELLYREARMRVIHTPWIEQYTPENHELMDDVVAQIIAHLSEGGVVAIHCHSGFGRGGVIIAAVLGSLRLDDPQTIVSQLQSIDSQFLAQPKPKAWAIAHLSR